jgi:hypothetical protein
MYYTAEDQKYITQSIAEVRRSRAEVLYAKITHFMDYLKK